jgi:hypothetical protein
MLHNMDRESFMLSLERMIAQHRIPESILCDNGTNFVGAHTDIKRLWKDTLLSVQKECRQEIKWNFSPPDAPWFNSPAERIVGLSKNALVKVLNPSVNLTDELLLTSFKIVQGILNDRPIAFTETDHRDPESLTPNHFLSGGRIFSDLAPDQKDESLLDRYRRILYLKGKFWQRYVLEVTPHLREYSKWMTKRDEIVPGDVVCILDEAVYQQTKRWPLGLVVKVHKGLDNIARRFTIKTKSAKKGYCQRASNRLFVVLPANSTPLGGKNPSLEIGSEETATACESTTPAACTTSDLKGQEVSTKKIRRYRKKIYPINSDNVATRTRSKRKT